MTENFDLDKVKTLSPIEAKEYVNKFFIPLTDGNHALLVNGKYEIYDEAVVRKTYFKRMSQELNKYYFQEKTDLKTIVYEINKPVLYGKYLNLCPKMKHTYKKKEEFSQNILNKLNKVLQYIKEVLCSDRDNVFKFLMLWIIANMMQGNKNDSALLLKGPQGAGKSSLFEFIRKHVLGYDLCFQGGSGPLKSRFNSELSGKLLNVFEELENFSASEWIAIGSILKRKITSPTIMIERKGQDAREEKNLGNDVLISNHDAVQDDDGRRYFVLDILAKYIGNKEYFRKLYECFTDEVGQAFYSHCIDIDVTGFNSQAYPETQSKLDSYSKRLDNVYKFIRDEFVLTKTDIKRQTVQELYDHYIGYTTKNSIKTKSKIDFHNVLKDIGIKWKPSHCQNVYKMSYEELQAIADKFHWVHELDEYKTNDDKSIDVSLLFNQKIEILEDENDDMRRYIKRLEKYVIESEERLLKKEQPKQKVTKVDFVQLADNQFLNTQTNEVYETFDDSQMEDDEDLF